MKALSVRQPWASFIAHGWKTVECRSWPTKYRGELIICSSKGDDILEVDPPANELILPGGMALGVVDLFDCRRMTKEDFDAAMVPEDKEWEANVLKGYAWHLKPIYELIPTPVKGKLGIFNLDIPLKKLPPEFIDHALYLDWLKNDKKFRNKEWEEYYLTHKEKN